MTMMERFVTVQQMHYNNKLKVLRLVCGYEMPVSQGDLLQGHLIRKLDALTTWSTQNRDGSH